MQIYQLRKGRSVLCLSNTKGHFICPVYSFTCPHMTWSYPDFADYNIEVFFTWYVKLNSKLSMAKEAKRILSFTFPNTRQLVGQDWPINWENYRHRCTRTHTHTHRRIFRPNVRRNSVRNYRGDQNPGSLLSQKKQNKKKQNHNMNFFKRHN